MEKITRYLELPPEIIFNLPKIVLVGNLQIMIENHRGLIEYSPGKIRISVNLGELEIKGKELVIASITKDEICLEGDISGLQYHQ